MKKENLNKTHIFGIALTIIVFGLASACSNSSSVPEITEEESDLSPDLITLTSEQFNENNLQVVTLDSQSFYNTIPCTGVFDLPPQNITSISTFYEGYVKNIELLPGQSVRKGQVLFTLENPEYLKKQQEYLEIENQLSFLESDYERQKKLASNNVTSQKSYFKAETDFNAAKIKYNALKKELKMMNINPSTLSPDNISSQIRIYSPISGYITAVSLVNGQLLDSKQEAVTIIDPNHLHLELQVFEKDLEQIEVGQEIHFTTGSNTNSYQAKVYLINKSIDMKNRTISLHGHIEVGSNEQSKFIPGMFVNAEIHTTKKKLPALPIDAIVNVDGKYFALLEGINSNDEDRQFTKVEVIPGLEVNGFVEIKNANNFTTGSEFLAKGAFNLLAE